MIIKDYSPFSIFVLQGSWSYDLAHVNMKNNDFLFFLKKKKFSVKS